MTKNTAKKHGDGPFVANDASSDAVDGEPTTSAGFLGRGKLMSSWTTAGPEDTILGDTATGGIWANDKVLCDCNSLTAP